MTSIYSIFNKHLGEFIDDILILFPNNPDIMMAKKGIEFIKNGNPKLILQYWVTHISAKYAQQIEDQDISFFINNDYTSDVKTASDSNSIIQAIDKLRQPIRDMNVSDQQKCMQYISNLTKLSNMASG